MLLSLALVKFFPDPKLKTGVSGLYVPFSTCIFLRVRKSSTGQQPKPVKGNMSKNSHVSPDFGLRSRRINNSELDSATSAQRKVVEGSCDESVGANSSPKRADAK